MTSRREAETSGRKYWKRGRGGFPVCPRVGAGLSAQGRSTRGWRGRKRAQRCRGERGHRQHGPVGESAEENAWQGKARPAQRRAPPRRLHPSAALALRCAPTLSSEPSCRFFRREAGNGGGGLSFPVHDFGFSRFPPLLAGGNLLLGFPSTTHK